MKLIIAGSRTFANREILEQTLAEVVDITEVVSGCARGADIMGEAWAYGMDIPIRQFPADWATHGRSAGYLRNEQMADYADSAVVFWDGTSRGAAHMIDQMDNRGKPCKVVIFEGA